VSGSVTAATSSPYCDCAASTEVTATQPPDSDRVLVADNMLGYVVTLAQPAHCIISMKCPNCRHENSIEAKFCEQCAAPLRRVCANCGSPASSTAKFCAQCGHPLPPVADEPSRVTSPRDYTPQHLAEKILTSKAALEGERKQVTVLFADVKGSMELLVDRDPEQTQTLIGPVIEAMMEAVHRYEGTVNQVLGDGIMALFGAPLASEDHAVRACYAALRMQENVKRYAEQVQASHGISLAIRVGINSGEIVVHIIGNDLHMEYAAVGQTVHLAARMEQAAAPGSVLTTAETAQLVEGYVDVKPLGLLPVKGLAEPVAAYEVIGAGAARTRLQAAAKRGLTSFVDRELELEQLRAAQQLAETGQAQVAAIIAEPGIGKSRLLHEFLHSRHTTGRLIFESVPPSYARAISYLPVIELLKQYFELGPHDTTQAIQENVSGKILALDPSLQDAVPPILDLLDALDRHHPFHSLDPSEHRQKSYQAVIRLLLTESLRQPIVAVFEDLHWYDTLTLGLLNELVVSAHNARLLIVVTYRPEYGDQWKNRPNYRQLRVYPLMSRNLAEFLDVLLGSDTSLRGLKSFLAERASGNPFFVEEIVRTLVDTGVIEGEHGNFHLARPISSIDVPPSIQPVLAARIDRLPAAEKQLLQEAAVIGQDIPFGLLHEISGLSEEALRRLLDKLQAAEFIYTTQLFPDLQYTFKHSLTCDVVYGGVLREHRRAAHARVVNALEKLYSDRLAEQVERLAYHSVRGELKEKAVHYLQQAGTKAAARGAPQEARTLFEQALDNLKSRPETPETMAQSFEILLELRPVLRQLAEGWRMRDCLREAEVLAERLRDDRRRGLIRAFNTGLHASLAELDEALTSGFQALEIAQRLDDLKLRLLATSLLEQAHFYRGEYQQVIELATGNLAALPSEWVNERFGLTVPLSVLDRAWLTMSLAELGRFEDAARYEAEAIQIAEQTEHAFAIGWAYLAASRPHLLKGEWQKARSLAELWITTIRSGNVAIHLPWAVAFSAWTLAHLGEASESLKRVQEAKQLLDQQAGRGTIAHHGWAYHAAGRACLLLGRLDEAQGLAERALATSQHQPGFAAHALHLLGDVATHSDRFDPQTGETHYRQAHALAQQHGMRPLAAYCQLGLGKLYHRTGKTKEAGEARATAQSMFRGMDMAFWLEQIGDG
jgi:class 3 adenylate cyclase/DNA-binding Lrp family transcriptional regulator